MLPQMIVSMLKSFGKSVVKYVSSPTKIFTNLVKKGEQFGKDANDLTKALSNDTKKLLKDKLNFKTKITTYLEDQRAKITDKILGINSKSIYERHKYINKLRKTGASIAEILEFEKEYGLNPDRAKAEYKKLVPPRIEGKPIEGYQEEQEEVLEVPEEAGVIGQYISKAMESLSNAGRLHSKETIKTLVELDNNMSSENKQLLDGIITSMDESNLLSSKNSEEIQRQVAIASQTSTKIQEKLARMNEEQSQAIADGFKNIEESVRLYSETQGQKIDMLSALSEMAQEKPEEDDSHTFAELVQGNSLIIDLISQSQKSPMEIMQSFDQAMNEFVNDIGKEVGFYGGLLWAMLDKSSKGDGLLGGITRKIRDMIGNLIGIDPKGEKEEEVNVSLNQGGYTSSEFRNAKMLPTGNFLGTAESQLISMNEKPVESIVQKEENVQREVQREPDVILVNNNNIQRGNYYSKDNTPPQPNGDRRP